MWTKKWKLVNSKRGHVELVELPKPIRHGYKRSFVLRDDVARSDDAKILREVLKEIQHVQFSKNKEFEYRNYTDRKMKPMEHEPNPIEHKKWNELQKKSATFKIARVIDMFEEIWIANRDFRGRIMKSGRNVFVFRKRWMLAEKVEPNYMTHRFIINPQLESELQELHNHIVNHNLERKLSKATSRSSSWRDDWAETKELYLGKILDREKNEILKTYNVAL